MDSRSRRMVPADAPGPDDPCTPHRERARRPVPPEARPSPSSPELETLTFHPRPDAGGLVARLDGGTLVPPHPDDAPSVAPGEAWACTLARGPGGDLVARLVARVEPSPPEGQVSTDASRTGPSQGAGDGAPSHPSPSSSRSGGAALDGDARDELEQRREELRRREEMLEAQLDEVRDRILDLDDVLGRG